MDMSKYGGVVYLKVDDLRGGPRRVTIAKVKDGNFDKPDAVFTDESILSLNATNVRALLKVYGPDSNDWTLREVELQLGRVKYQGAPTESIVVVPLSPGLTAAELKEAQDRVNAGNRAEMDDSIPFS
jgi:hypothetical protein